MHACVYARARWFLAAYTLCCDARPRKRTRTTGVQFVACVGKQAVLVENAKRNTRAGRHVFSFPCLIISRFLRDFLRGRIGPKTTLLCSVRLSTRFGHTTSKTRLPHPMRLNTTRRGTIQMELRGDWRLPRVSTTNWRLFQGRLRLARRLLPQKTQRQHKRWRGRQESEYQQIPVSRRSHPRRGKCGDGDFLEWRSGWW